jgi:hypothetical protein
MSRFAWTVVIALVLSPAAVLAQYAPPSAAPGVDGPRNAVNGLYLELGGAAAVYSVNYERFLQDDFALRVGFGYLSVSGGASDGSSTTTATVSMLTIPVTASFVGLRSGSHALELGGGAVIARFSGTASNSSGSEAFGSASGVVGTAIVGYRYAPLNGGMNFRIAYTPMFGEGGLFNWGGVAIGTVF